jgi:hypothetical protein
VWQPTELQETQHLIDPHLLILLDDADAGVGIADAECPSLDMILDRLLCPFLLYRLYSIAVRLGDFDVLGAPGLAQSARIS